MTQFYIVAACFLACLLGKTEGSHDCVEIASTPCDPCKHTCYHRSIKFCGIDVHDDYCLPFCSNSCIGVTCNTTTTENITHDCYDMVEHTCFALNTTHNKCCGEHTMPLCTPCSSTNTTAGSSADDNLSTGAVIGIAVGSLFAGMILCGLFYSYNVFGVNYMALSGTRPLASGDFL